MPSDHSNDRERPDTPPVPTTAAQWREVLKGADEPDLGDLPFRQRRRARRAWRSARREQRIQWIRDERRKTPTGPAIPIVALVLAVGVLICSWLWPQAQSKPAPAPATTLTQAPVPAAQSPTATATTERASSPRPTDPEGIARAFFSAYSTRNVLQDGSHAAAVHRAAPYASQALVDNLTHHADFDFNHLVAVQATESHATRITLIPPPEGKRPAPDTDLRVYLQASVDIAVTGPEPTTYTRVLTAEISRADTKSQWMVTRVLGIEE
ncbi:hypothetical protein [Kitasatospora sp. NPDC088783]|uniref:hypothetical protein n=1 Tax=Kitasatospora sp. NPDC088783 TaxID=3364077 RepID=UPI00381F9B81